MAPCEITSILVATDLGSDSEELVGIAATLASRAGAELHLIHSLDLPFTPPKDAMRRTGFFGHIEAAEVRLRELAERVTATGVNPATENVIIYTAHQAILDRAEEIAADLIVLGSHRGFRKPRFLGTTADRVARYAKVPCLVIGGAAAFPVDRVGILVDFSSAAAEALQTALVCIDVLAQPRDGREGATLQLLHVAHPLLLATNPELDAAIDRQLSDLIDQSAGKADADHVTMDGDVLWDDKPADAVEQWVDRQHIGLIVLATHGGGAVQRALIGSMAYSMARRTPCPVLLVPPRKASG